MEKLLQGTGKVSDVDSVDIQPRQVSMEKNGITEL
jgi:hypothetical protein